MQNDTYTLLQCTKTRESIQFKINQDQLSKTCQGFHNFFNKYFNFTYRRDWRICWLIFGLFHHGHPNLLDLFVPRIKHVCTNVLKYTENMKSHFKKVH